MRQLRPFLMTFGEEHSGHCNECSLGSITKIMLPASFVVRPGLTTCLGHSPENWTKEGAAFPMK